MSFNGYIVFHDVCLYPQTKLNFFNFTNWAFNRPYREWVLATAVSGKMCHRQADSVWSVECPLESSLRVRALFLG